MKPPRYWRQLERHDLSAEYPDLEQAAATKLRESVKKGILNKRRVTLHEGKVLDGWQFYRACVDQDIQPEFQPLPKGWTPEEYVEAVNDTRRQESQQTLEARANRRRQRVEEARRNGESIRTIAEKEGVSTTTVQRDLMDAAGVTGVTPEPDGGKVTGKDGKKQAASKPKKPKAEKPRTLAQAVEEETGGELKDSLGSDVPPGLRAVFEAADTFKGILSQFTEIKKAVKSLSDGRAGHYLHPQDITLAIENARRSIRFAMPYAVCPVCSGLPKNRQANCPCKDKGWLPEENYNLLPQEYRQ